MAVPTTSAAAAQSRLLNRELSWLEFNARVLELAADERCRCSSGQVLLDLLVEPRRVLHGARGRPAWSRPARLAVALARRPHAAGGARRDPRARARADARAVEAVERRAAARARGRAGSSSAGRRLADEELASSRASSGDLPGADAARGRPGPAVPVHLRALALARRLRARPGRPARSASPASRCPRRCRASCAVGARGAVRAARGRDRVLPARALPRHGDRRSAARSVSRATPTSRSRTKPTTCSRRSSRAAAAPFGDVVRLEVSSSMSRGDARAHRAGLGARRRRSTASRGCSTSPTSAQLDDARPPRAEGRAVAPVTQPRLAARSTDGDDVRRDPPRGHARPPAVRVVRDERRGVRPRGRGGPGRARASRRPCTARATNRRSSRR